MNQRTTTQNKSLHKLFTDISTHCVAHGIDQRTILSSLTDYQCSVTPQAIKEVWRSMQIAMTGKESTADLTTAEVDQVFGVFSKFWSELTGEYFVWPSIEALIHSYDNT